MEQPPREDVEWRESCDVINEGTIGVPKDYREMGFLPFWGKSIFTTYLVGTLLFIKNPSSQTYPPKCRLKTTNWLILSVCSRFHCLTDTKWPEILPPTSLSILPVPVARKKVLGCVKSYWDMSLILEILKPGNILAQCYSWNPYLSFFEKFGTP